MPPFARYLLVRVLLMPITLIAVTFGLYAMISITPPEVRALLYLPARQQADAQFLPRDALKEMTRLTVERYHLDDPLPVQYVFWLVGLVEHQGGYSPTLKMQVLPALLRRTPVTAELTLFSLLAFIPLGLLSGLRAGWRQNSRGDQIFRLAAFIATSLPPFILGLLLLSVFYIGLRWLPPSRLGVTSSLAVSAPDFHTYTGLLTVDGLLNGRYDISLEAAKHLILPVITLSLVHWATLGRITRTTVITELKKEYILAGRARGIPERRLQFSHALRNALAPALSSTALSAASLFTGVFIVKSIFAFNGLSEVITRGMSQAPDAPAALGFVVYSVTIVLVIMLILDLLQAFFDPRVRERLSNS
jgi:ABC-type dipeptide/oligopeptide/nickel transport system permease component